MFILFVLFGKKFDKKYSNNYNLEKTINSVRKGWMVPIQHLAGGWELIIYHYFNIFEIFENDNDENTKNEKIKKYQK